MTTETPCARHDLSAAVQGCGCSMRDISHCVICGRDLPISRVHVDTCGARCFRALLKAQRGEVSAAALSAALSRSSPIRGGK